MIQLKDTHDATVSHFEMIDHLDLTYGNDKWSIRQILHHLADAESVLFDRVRRLIAEPKQVIVGFEQDMWVKSLCYDERPLGLSKEIFSISRKANMWYIEKFYDKIPEKEYIHSKSGLKTFVDLCQKIASHNQKHLDQITMALSKS